MDGRSTRREALRTAMLTAGGLAAATPLSRAIAAAAAAAPAPGGLEAIEHVVILIQENRSFDHYFGSLRGVRGFSDPGVLHQADGRPVFDQPGYPSGRDPDGHLLPFHLDTATSRAACTHDINHSWGPQHDSYDGGRMDGFVRSHLAADGAANGPLTMGYYTRGDLPFYYALADAFTICDGYHCALIGPTNPNRFMSVSATIDPAGQAGGPVLDDSTSVPYSLGWRTYPEALQQAGVSWKVYQSPEQVSAYQLDNTQTANNVLAYFKPFGDRTGALYENAFLPTFPGTLNQDVAAGTLPAVSWVLFESAVETDEHPPAPSELGEYEVSQLLDALTSNPQVWARTVLFITWDENGGFFDHVVPPTAPPGTDGEYLTVEPLPAAADGIAGPIGLGLRVPLLVVSPFARGGYTCSDTFDHTSLLRFIETRFGVAVPNLSAWRRANTGDLTATLGLADPSDTSVPNLPATSPADPTVLRECSPGSYGSGAPGLPADGDYPVPANSVATQEPGAPRRRRPSSAPAPIAAGAAGPSSGPTAPRRASAPTPAAPSPGRTRAHKRGLRVSVRGIPRHRVRTGVYVSVSATPAALVREIVIELDGRTIRRTHRKVASLAVPARHLHRGENRLRATITDSAGTRHTRTKVIRYEPS